MYSDKPKFGKSKKTRTSVAIKEKKQQKQSLIQKEPENEKIRAIYNDVNDTKDIMQDNIDKMTQNIETAEDLEEKTNSMVDKATLFKKESKQMKKAMCWRKYKLWILIGTVVIIILIVIFIAIAIPVINLFKD